MKHACRMSYRLAWTVLQQEWVRGLLHGPWYLQEQRLRLRLWCVAYAVPCTWCYGVLVVGLGLRPMVLRLLPHSHATSGWHGPGCDQPDVISGGSSGVFTFNFKDTSDGEKLLLNLKNGANNCTWCVPCLLGCAMIAQLRCFCFVHGFRAPCTVGLCCS